MDEKNTKIVKINGKTTCACGDGCNCGCGYGRGSRVLWWLLGIVVLFVAFAIGVKVGEFRAELRNMYQGYYRGYPMMQGQEGYGQDVTPPGMLTNQTSTANSNFVPPTTP